MQGHAARKRGTQSGGTRQAKAFATGNNIAYTHGASDTAPARTGQHVRFRIFASFALSAGAAAIVIAQSGSTPTTPPNDPQQPPRFRVEANFVRVDVYPTTDGKPVMDLRAEDFEVLEDGVLQSIQSFAHVVARPSGPQSQRSEPNTIEASRQLAANPHNRVFVLFLDTYHVSTEGSWHAREPLIRLIDRILGPDDLVGIMTPRMAAADVVLARKTDVMADGLRSRWPWGERFMLQMMDERDKLYQACYPMMSQDAGAGDGLSAQARSLIARRRERATLDSMRELVLYLRDVREERKAILTVTEGWLLFRPDLGITNLRTDSATGKQEPAPGPDPITVGPDGRLTTKNRNNTSGVSRSDCDAERVRLAMEDNDLYLREIIGEANRGNATFYTIDPRGLPAFDTPMGPARPPDVITDARMLRIRLDSMRTLAEATDGIAVVNNNDLDVGMKRISDDLSSYYLLGYYSTNGRLDGRFHNIKVRVKRPGVEVRARKGYRAATVAEVTAAKTAAAAPVSEARAAVNSAISALARLRPDARFSLNAAPITSGTSAAVSTVWVVGELQSVTAADPWMKGGTAEIEVSAAGRSATANVTLAPGERTFAIPVTLATAADTGIVAVRAKLAGTAPDAERLSAAINIDVTQRVSQPLLFRRGPATGNRLVPAALFQFSRTERARLELPVGADAKPGGARLLDKTGQPLAIPVTLGERVDAATGQRWLTADITLAALGAGDYAIEIAMTTGTEEQKSITAFRVGR
jgi:VWFA-related protein